MNYTPETLFNNLLSSMAKQAQLSADELQLMQTNSIRNAVPARVSVALPTSKPVSKPAPRAAPVQHGKYLTPEQLNAELQLMQTNSIRNAVPTRVSMALPDLRSVTAAPAAPVAPAASAPKPVPAAPKPAPAPAPKPTPRPAPKLVAKPASKPAYKPTPKSVSRPAPVAPVRQGNYITPEQFNAWRKQMADLTRTSIASRGAGTTGGANMHTPEEIKYLRSMVAAGKAGRMTLQDMQKSLSMMKNIRNRYNAPIVYNNGAISYGKPTNPKDLTKDQVQVGRGIYMDIPKATPPAAGKGNDFGQFFDALHQQGVVQRMADRYNQGIKRDKPIRLKDGSLYFGNQAGLTAYNNRSKPQTVSKVIYGRIPTSSTARRKIPSHMRQLRGPSPVNRLY